MTTKKKQSRINYPGYKRLAKGTASSTPFISKVRIIDGKEVTVKFFEASVREVS